MKHATAFTTLVVFILCSLMISCTNDSASPNPSSTALQVGDGWQVIWFWDKDKDETSDLSSYRFSFKDGGVFEANLNGSTTTGTWSITNNDNTQRLVLFLPTAKPLSEVNDDWIIEALTETSIKLKDDNDEHLEELHLER